MEDNQENVQNEVNNVEQKVNENKPEKSGKGKTIVLMIILLLLVLAIGLCGGYLLSNKNSENSTNGNENKTEQSVENKVENKTENKAEQLEENKNEDSTSKEINESNELVYDAEYLKNKEEKKISINYSNETFSTLSQLKVPYINVDSDEAKKANQEIKEIAQEQYERFGKKDGDDTYYLTEMNYLYSCNGDNLSVLLLYRIGITGTGSKIESLKSYNIKINNQNIENKNTNVEYNKNKITSKIDEFSKKENLEGDKLTMVDGEYFIYNNQIYAICTGGYTSGGVRSSNNYTLFDVNAVKEIPYYEIVDVLNNNKTVTETDKEYAKEYIKIIDKIESEYPNSDLKYDLIYFNNDEIPDLVTNETSVYVYKDGKIYTPIENVPTGIGGSKFIDYYEKKSVAVSFGTGDAGLECGETFFLFNEKNEKDEYSYTTKGADAEDEEMKKRQEEALKLYGGYRHGGEKITEQEFVKKLREYGVEFDTEKLWNTKAPERKALEALRTTEDVKSELRMVK